jgi:hypothetical protein
MNIDPWNMPGIDDKIIPTKDFAVAAAKSHMKRAIDYEQALTNYVVKMGELPEGDFWQLASFYTGLLCQFHGDVSNSTEAFFYFAMFERESRESPVEVPKYNLDDAMRFAFTWSSKCQGPVDHLDKMFSSVPEIGPDGYDKDLHCLADGIPLGGEELYKSMMKGEYEDIESLMEDMGDSFNKANKDRTVDQDDFLTAAEGAAAFLSASLSGKFTRNLKAAAMASFAAAVTEPDDE